MIAVFYKTCCQVELSATRQIESLIGCSVTAARRAKEPYIGHTAKRYRRHLSAAGGKRINEYSNFYRGIFYFVAINLFCLRSE